MKPKKTDLLAEQVRQLAYSTKDPETREILIQAAVRLKDLYLIAEFYHKELHTSSKMRERRKRK